MLKYLPRYAHIFDCMGIVVITIPGTDKDAFVRDLHEATGHAVDLVIVQRKPTLSPLTRLTRFLTKTPPAALPTEIYHASLLRLQPDVRAALSYFRGHIPTESVAHAVPVLEVPSVNSEVVIQKLQALAPDLLVVWGSTILQPAVLATAKQSINLHFGYCPYYRGAMANQLAVLHGEHDRIGATIHHINERADAGDIIHVVTPPQSDVPPTQLFRELKAAATNTFIKTAAALHQGQSLPVTPQDVSQSKNGTLKGWTPRTRYQVGRKVLAWEAKQR